MQRSTSQACGNNSYVPTSWDTSPTLGSPRPPGGGLRRLMKDGNGSFRREVVKSYLVGTEFR